MSVNYSFTFISVLGDHRLHLFVSRDQFYFAVALNDG